jgi:hypothetical protein
MIMSKQDTELSVGVPLGFILHNARPLYITQRLFYSLHRSSDKDLKPWVCKLREVILFLAEDYPIFKELCLQSLRKQCTENLDVSPYSESENIFRVWLLLHAGANSWKPSGLTKAASNGY